MRAIDLYSQQPLIALNRALLIANDRHDSSLLVYLDLTLLHWNDQSECLRSRCLGNPSRNRGFAQSYLFQMTQIAWVTGKNDAVIHSLHGGKFLPCPTAITDSLATLSSVLHRYSLAFHPAPQPFSSTGVQVFRQSDSSLRLCFHCASSSAQSVS